MKGSRLTSRTIVLVYFTCFALAWLALAASQVAAPSPEIAHGWLQADRASGGHVGLLFTLAIHAAVVSATARQAPHWFFDHGPLAVVASGAPLVALLAHLWFVPAFFYLIAVLHVWLACRHESIGKLQSTRSPSMENGGS
ncbi:MAG TPA: hypothetical protein VMU96_02235 [Casimicrobiaceae bacterium]|nr:hypothetical protein [Casimicrobiaceae bacterium]